MPVLNITDFALVALVVLIFNSTASLTRRQRRNVDHIDRIDRKLNALLQHHGIQMASWLSPEVQQLASDRDQKLNASAIHKKQTGVSLEEATSDVEEFIG
ncbi:MAG: hypothetical protein C4320_06105 [Armatimonadota bacterium]